MKRKGFPVAILVVGILGLIGWSGFASYKQFTRTQRIKQEVSALQAEADRIRQENEGLSERIGYFASRDFQEQEAKRKLGLQKPDESVVGVEEGADSASQPAEEVAVHPLAQTAPDPMYKKWWQLFFSRT